MSSIFGRFGDDQTGLNIYEAIVQRSPIGILILDQDGTIVSANQAWTTMTDYSAAETIGERLTEFIAAKESEKVRRALNQKAAVDTLRVPCKVKFGELLDIELSLHTVRTEKALVMNFVAYTGPHLVRREVEVEHGCEERAGPKKTTGPDWSQFLGEHWQAVLTTIGAGLTFIILVGVQFNTMQDQVHRQEQTIEKIQTMLEKLVSEQARGTERKPQPKQGS